jgi:hypothetical protein
VRPFAESIIDWRFVLHSISSCGVLKQQTYSLTVSRTRWVVSVVTKSAISRAVIYEPRRLVSRVRYSTRSPMAPILLRLPVARFINHVTNENSFVYDWHSFCVYFHTIPIPPIGKARIATLSLYEATLADVTEREPVLTAYTKNPRFLSIQPHSSTMSVQLNYCVNIPHQLRCRRRLPRDFRSGPTRHYSYVTVRTITAGTRRPSPLRFETFYDPFLADFPSTPR